MAEYSKQLQVQRSDGDLRAAKLYSTEGEAGPNNIPLQVDGSPAWAALTSVDDPNATAGRVKLSTGETYAIGQSGVPPYAYATYTTSGSFTVPSGVGRIKITCVGGGAGGMTFKQSELGLSADGTNILNGCGGGDTVVGSVTAKGAVSAYASRDVVRPSTGTVNGIEYVGNDSRTGAPSVTLYGIDSIGRVSGGAGGFADPDGFSGYTGGSGYTSSGFMNVTPGQVIAVNIGQGGNAFRCGTGYFQGSYGTGGNHAGSGSHGAALIEWGRGVVS